MSRLTKWWTFLKALISEHVVLWVALSGKACLQDASSATNSAGACKMTKECTSWIASSSHTRHESPH